MSNEVAIFLAARLKVDSLKLQLDKIYRDDLNWISDDTTSSLFVSAATILEALSTSLYRLELLNDTEE